MKPLFAFTLLALSAAIARADDAPIAYFPFEDSTKPALAKGAQATDNAPTFTYETGNTGRAIVIADKELPLPGAGNFERAKGSLAFWFAPAADLKDAAPNHHILFKLTNFQISYFANSKRLIFMTGKTVEGEGFKWDYSVSSGDAANWKAGQWHHIAASWDAKSGAKSLYIDGKLAATGQSDLIRDDNDIKGLALGSAEAPGLYDELAIWNRVLTPAEIAAVNDAATPLAKAPTETANAAQTPRLGLAIADKPVQTIVAPGEKYIANVPIEAGARAWKGAVRFILLDFWERERASQTVAVELTPTQKKTLAVEFVAPAKGVFKIAATLTDGEQTVARDVASFAAWPRPSAPPDANSFFGNHLNAYYNDDFLDQAARLGQSWARNHNLLQATWWPRVQAEPGAFNFSGDAQIAALKKRQIPVLGQFFGTPYWATAGEPLAPQKPGAYPYPAVPQFDLLREYVAQTVAHYKEEISVWEVGNEPDVSKFWAGSPEEFAAYSQTAIAAARAADPKSTLLVGGFTAPAWRWHDAAARAGALKGADAISFHWGCPLIAPEENLRQLQATIAHFDGLARETVGRKLPLWSTEGGTPDTTWLRGLDNPQLPPANVRTPMNWRAGAIATVQGTAVMQSQGVVKHFIYFQNPIAPGAESYANGSMLDANNAPRPKLMARVAMESELGGTPFFEKVQLPAARFWANVYGTKGQSGSTVLWWAGENAQLKANVNWPAKITRAADLMGNDINAVAPLEITEEPAYLHLDATPEQTIAALKSAKLTVVRDATPLPVAATTTAATPKLSPLPDYVAAREAPAQVFTVDLRAKANVGLADEKTGDGKGGWTDEGPFNDLRDLKPGKQTLAGVPFEIIDPAKNDGRAVITLRGSATTPRHIVRADGIDLKGRKARVLYFLQSAAWSGNGQIGRYVAHYADGKSVEIPIKSGANTGNWWSGYVAGEESRLVAVEVQSTATGQKAWRYLRVWEWSNPRPDVPIERLDFVSDETAQSPILLAITGVAGF